VAASPGQSRRPAVTIGPTGWSRNTNDVATPKLPPPPCNPQNSSGFSSSLAVTWRPSAVTRSTDTRLSQARPCERSSQPDPPPSVKSATPVVETRPPVVASPCSWAARSNSPHVTPAPTRRSEEHTSELQSRENLVCRLLLEKKKEENVKNGTRH